jgi:CubicO group peptidase (beta-lactamase class C family)
MIPTRFGLGYFLPSSYSELMGDASFGHSGAGGSLGLADPETKIGFGYVMNKMQLNLGGDNRTTSLIDAIKASL